MRMLHSLVWLLRHRHAGLLHRQVWLRLRLRLWHRMLRLRLRLRLGHWMMWLGLRLRSRHRLLRLPHRVLWPLRHRQVWLRWMPLLLGLRRL
jgi:hypothetical protein